jgi:hypothetical protein
MDFRLLRRNRRRRFTIVKKSRLDKLLRLDRPVSTFWTDGLCEELLAPM